jgi:hypothetical protein
VPTDVPSGRGPGRWMRILHDEFGDHPRWSAIVWCPSCRKPLALINHEIGVDGTVTEPVGHPETYEPCSWHPAQLRLVGWEHNPPAPEPLPYHECEKCQAKGRQYGGWGTWSGGPGLICPKCIAEIWGRPPP